jgi:hypothetical protein
MKRHSVILMSVTVLICIVGCGCQQLGIKPAAILPGNDPIVVNTERATKAAFSAYKATIEYDHENLAFMKDKLPQVHEVVQKLRVEFPPIYRATREATKTFKQTRLPQDAAVMNQKLGELNKQQIAAQQALATATQRKTEADAGRDSATEQPTDPGVRAID